MRRSNLLALLMLTLAAIPAAAQDFLSGDGPMAAVKREVGVDQNLNKQLPLDVEMVDESGRKVKLGDYFNAGKPVVIVPVYYTCPTLCNMILDGVANSIENIRYNPGRDYTIVTFSFDPKDTPQVAAEKKAKYVKRFGRPGAAEGWHFLTSPDETNIRKLTDAIGFRYKYDQASKQYAHGAAIMVATPTGRLSQYFYGIGYPSKDLRLGIVEASQGKTGHIADELMLLCFTYNPATGKYSMMAMDFVRVGGVLIVLVVGGFIGLMIYKERRRRASEAA